MIHRKTFVVSSLVLAFVITGSISFAQSSKSQGKAKSSTQSSQDTGAPDRIWDGSDIMIGFGGVGQDASPTNTPQFLTKKFVCPLYAPNGQAIPGGSVTYDMSKVIFDGNDLKGTINTHFVLKGTSRDADVEVELTEVAGGIAAQGGKMYLVGGGEIPVPGTDKTFIGRCKYEIEFVPNDATGTADIRIVRCFYCSYMLVTGLRTPEL